MARLSVKETRISKTTFLTNYSKNSPSSTGGRCIAKININGKIEHLFYSGKCGIIQSVEKPEGTDCMDKMDHNAHSVYLMYYHLIMVVK